MHALVTADTIGGVWTYARELVTGLLARGARVTLVSFGEIPSLGQMEWMDGLPGLDFRPTGFHLEWMQDAEQDLQFSTDYLMTIIAEVKPDILHLNQYAYGALPVDVPKVVVAHSDVVSWWVAVHGEEPRDSHWFRWYRRTVARGLYGATHVVAPSKWMLEALESYYGRPERASVIYNGRTPKLFNPHAEKEAMVLGVGRLWDSGKQVALLTQADLALPVWIAGAGSPPEPASAPSRRKVKFKGELSETELRYFYSRAAIYAATSRYEPFGLAPLEAALSRCALVANDIPSFHELWGDNAVYFRYNDAESLAAVIQHMAANRESRIQYGNLAYRHARQHFTASRMVEEYVGLYQSLVTAEMKAG